MSELLGADDAQKYHRVMQLLRDMRMEHGLCKPRERKACTACNAKDALNKMIDEYTGAPVTLCAPNAIELTGDPLAGRPR